MHKARAEALRQLVGVRYTVDGLCSDTLPPTSFSVKVVQQLWPLVMFVELGLRNHVDLALRHRYPGVRQDQSWLLTPPAALVRVEHRIHKARSQLVRRRLTVTHEALVDQLPFGFWSALLARKNINGLWPDVSHAFAHAPGRDWHLVGPRVSRVVSVRNKIAHHEAVERSRVPHIIADGLTLISYMAPAAVEPIQQLLDSTSFVRSDQPPDAKPDGAAASAESARSLEQQ